MPRLGRKKSAVERLTEMEAQLPTVEAKAEAKRQVVAKAQLIHRDDLALRELGDVPQEVVENSRAQLKKARAELAEQEEVLAGFQDMLARVREEAREERKAAALAVLSTKEKALQDGAEEARRRIVEFIELAEDVQRRWVDYEQTRAAASDRSGDIPTPEAVGLVREFCLPFLKGSNYPTWRIRKSAGFLV